MLPLNFISPSKKKIMYIYRNKSTHNKVITKREWNFARLNRSKFLTRLRSRTALYILHTTHGLRVDKIVCILGERKNILQTKCRDFFLSLTLFLCFMCDYTLLIGICSNNGVSSFNIPLSFPCISHHLSCLQTTTI